MATKLITHECEIAYRRDGPAHAPVVIFMNGLGMDQSMWTPQLGAFSGSYQTLCYDLRGHGDTPGTQGDYSLQRLAIDVADLMDALDIPAAHLVGTSLGAMIAQQFALLYPERVSSLTLCATTSDPPREAWDKRIQAARRDGLARQVDNIVSRWFRPDFAATRPDVVRQMHAMVLAVTLDGYTGCAAAIRDMDLAGQIQTITAPTLVIAGDEDQVTPLSDLVFIAERIPKADLVRIPDAAHMPTIEQPEVCNAVILAFLARIPPAAVQSSPSSESRAVNVQSVFPTPEVSR